MPNLKARLVGVELYFDDLPAAKAFYQETLGLQVTSEQSGHHAQLDLGAAFLCLENKGAENYRSRDKAVIFLEVDDLKSAVSALGDRIVHHETGNSPWAVLHDPEGHNVLLLERNHRAI
jgi:catechol-2,3-dioxygenase